MKRLLITLGDPEESLFVEDLLQRLNIQFEVLSVPLNEDVKQSVINGQLAYNEGKMDQFVEIDTKDFWK